MTKKTKKVEVVQVSHTMNKKEFAEMLHIIEGQKLINSLDKTVVLNIKEDTDDYLLGYVITTQKSGIPPAHNPETGVSKALALDKKEGLGYANVFVYDKSLNLLFYEFEKMGFYLGTLRKILLDRCINQFDIPFDLIFLPVPKKDIFERMVRLKYYKELNVKLAKPQRLIKEFTEEKDALSYGINTLNELNSDSIDMTIKVSRDNFHGMPSAKIQKLLNKAMAIINRSEEQIVEKFTVTGYYQDLEDQTVKDEIDILTDRFRTSFQIEEPRILENPQIIEKCKLILKLYESEISKLAYLHV